MSLRAIVIGAGSTGAALAHDLALRGFEVVVVDRGEVAMETTGRNHGLLHSGGRYALKDPEAARECAEENAILRQLMPGLLELNGGLFVAFDEDELDYQEQFLRVCAQSEVPAERISVEEALRLEPNLNPDILAAVKVNDGVFDAYHVALSFLATAMHNGATAHTYTEVVDLLWQGHNVAGARVRDRRTGQERDMGADLVVNAAGPWAGEIAEMAGIHLPMAPTAGVMVAVGERWTRRVINRLRPPSDGDIIVPQRRNSVIGTTSWLIEDPDYISIPSDHVERMLTSAEEMVPGFRGASLRGISAAARPLVAQEEDATRGRELSRGVYSHDHSNPDAKGNTAPGFFTLTDGKTTTSRLMAELMGDLICETTGVDVSCRTEDYALLPYHAYYRDSVDHSRPRWTIVQRSNADYRPL